MLKRLILSDPHVPPPGVSPDVRHVRLLAVLLVPVAFGAGVVTGATLRPAPVVLTHSDPVAYTSSLPAWFCHYYER
jgi:hypothetical protein